MGRGRYIPQDVKVAVAVRDQGKCVKCGSKRNLQYHHVKSFAKGGKHTRGNLQLLCNRCHRQLHKDGLA